MGVIFLYIIFIHQASNYFEMLACCKYSRARCTTKFCGKISDRCLFIMISAADSIRNFIMYLVDFSGTEVRLGVKATATTCTANAKAKDLILEDNKVGSQNEYKSATISKFNC